MEGEYMNIVRLVGGYLAAVAVVATIIVGADAHAAEQKNEQKPAAKTEQKAEKSTNAYSYTAQPGDTYTQLVRKAVQTYGIVNKKDIGQARIIAIETKAAEESGWQEVAVGQKVSFTEAQVKAWVDAAMKLSDADVAAWQTYVPYVDFDTRSIGQ